jgi:putative MATE family efflux protein
MQGFGDTVTPLFIMLLTNAVNILLNYMLIYGKWGAPELGIAGSAIGSTIARGLGTLIILSFLMSGKYRMKLKLHDFRPYLSEFKAILRLGIPNSIQNVSRNINVLFLYRILSYTYLPTVAQASLGVGFSSEAIGFIPLMGLFTATGTMVGQNLGAGNPERAEQASWAAWKSGLSLMVFICLLFLLIPDKIVGAFNTDPSVIQSGSWYLRINAITQLFQSSFVFVGCLRGAGDSMRPLGAHLIGNWIIRLPLAYFLSTYTGLEEWGVWLAMAISASIECTIYLYLFMKGDWKKAKIR